MRPLGTVQRNVLECLIQTGTGADCPYPSGGWQWTTPSETVRILESLRRRGLVEARESYTSTTYYITDAGRAELGS